MSDFEQTGRGGSGAEVPARRESPRLAIDRPVIIKCAHWEDYEETICINISRDALLVVVEGDPPEQGDFLRVWAAVKETDRRHWTGGQVVRRATEVDGEGMYGVVIRLTEPDAEAIECLIVETEHRFPLPDDEAPEEDYSCFDDPNSDEDDYQDGVDIDLDEPPSNDPWTQPAPEIAQETPEEEPPAPSPPPTPEEPEDDGIPVNIGLLPAQESQTAAPSFQVKLSRESAVPEEPSWAVPIKNTPSRRDEELTGKTQEVPTIPEAEASAEPPPSQPEPAPNARPNTPYLPPPPTAVVQAQVTLTELEGEEADLDIQTMPSNEGAIQVRAETALEIPAIPENTGGGAIGAAPPRPRRRKRFDTLIDPVPAHQELQSQLDEADPTPASEPRRRKRLDTLVDPVAPQGAQDIMGAYIMKPEQGVEEVGAETLGFASGLERSDTLVSEETPDFAPPGAAGAQTEPMVEAAPEATKEPEPPPEPRVETPAPKQRIRRPLGEGVHIEVRAPASRRKKKGVKQIGTRASSTRASGTRASGKPKRAPAVVGRAEAPTVGIDFGTTYCKIAFCEGDEVILIEDQSSNSASRASVPSIVGWPDRGKTVVGEEARDLLATNPAQVIYSVKRVMGLTHSDPLANGLLGSLACATKAGPNDTILFDMFGEPVTVPDVASVLLAHLRKMASDFLGAEVRKAVLTYPVDFDQRAKRELELAARMARIEVTGMVTEPVAAAMGCGHDGSGHSHVAVYDFGGGTFDVSIVEVGQDRFEVRGAAGDRWLGGDDFDELMGRYVADKFQRRSKVSLHNRAEEWQRLLFACEEAKRWLTNLDSVDVVLPRAVNTAQGPKTLLVPLSKGAFEELSGDIITSSLEVCNQAAMEAGISPKEVDALLITGGTSRIPMVRAAAERFFGKVGLEGIHPQHAVVIGSAVRGAVLSGASVPEDFAERLRGQSAGGRTIGLALAGGITEHIIDKSHRPPTVAHRLYSTHRDGQTSIRLELVEGTSRKTDENTRIGGFVVQDLPAAAAGEISLDVYFELSSTGTLYVTAQERSTGQRAQGTFEMDE